MICPSSAAAICPAVAAQKKTAEAQLHLLESNVETMGVKLGMILVGPLAKMAGFLNHTLLPAAITVGGEIVGVFKKIIPVDAIEADWRKLMAFFGKNQPKPSAAQRAPFTGTGSSNRLAPQSNVTTFMGGTPAKAQAASRARFCHEPAKAWEKSPPA